MTRPGPFVPGICLLLAALPAACADTLSARLRGDQIYFAAPGLDLLHPPLLQRLRNGGAVTYDFHLTASGRSQPRRRAFERFVVSYDLWEEKFAVSGVRKAVGSARNLDARGVAAWCLDHVGILNPGWKPGDAIEARLEIHAADPRREPDLLDPDGIDVGVLVDLLARRRRDGRQRWLLESSQLRVTGSR